MICNKCGMQVGENNLYCTNCGNKLDDFIIDIKLTKKKKILKILGICAASLYVLSVLVIFIGVILCFPDPATGKNISGLNFNLLGTCCATLFIISIILVILIIILKSKLK